MATPRQEVERRTRQNPEERENPFLQYAPGRGQAEPEQRENPFLQYTVEDAVRPEPEPEGPGLLDRLGTALSGLRDRFFGDEEEPDIDRAGQVPPEPAEPEPAAAPSREELLQRPDAGPGRRPLAERLAPVPRIDLRAYREGEAVPVEALMETEAATEGITRREAIERGGRPEATPTEAALRIAPRLGGTTVRSLGRFAEALPGAIEAAAERLRTPGEVDEAGLDPTSRALRSYRRAEGLEQETPGAATADVLSRSADVLRETTGPAARAVAEAGERIEQRFPRSLSVEEGGAFQPGNWRWWVESGGDAVAQLGLSMATAGLAGGASAIPRYLAFAAPTAVLEGGGAYEEAKENALERGVDPEEAERLAGATAVLTAAGSSALEFLPGSVFVFDRVPGLGRVFGEALAERIARPGTALSFVAGASAEGLEEVSQEALGDAIAFTVGQDPDAFAGAIERYLASGTLGAVAGGAARVGQALARPSDTSTPEERARRFRQFLDEMPPAARAQVEAPLAAALENLPDNIRAGVRRGLEVDTDPARVEPDEVSRADATEETEEAATAVRDDSEPFSDPALEQLARSAYEATVPGYGDTSDVQVARAELERLEPDVREAVLRRIDHFRTIPLEDYFGREVDEDAEADVDEDVDVEPEAELSPVERIRAQEQTIERWRARQAEIERAFETGQDAEGQELTDEDFQALESELESLSEGLELAERSDPRQLVNVIQSAAAREAELSPLVQTGRHPDGREVGPREMESVRTELRELREARAEAVELLEQDLGLTPEQAEQAVQELEAEPAPPGTELAPAEAQEAVVAPEQRENPYMDFTPTQDRRERGLVAGIRRRLSEIMDPTVRQELEAKDEDIERAVRLLTESFVDPVTNIPNPTAFRRAQKNVDTDPEQYWLSIDLTNFKEINDNLGYPAGDARLAEVAAVMREIAEDLGVIPRNLFRAGGDEFSVAHTDPAILEEFGEQLVERLPDVQVGPWTSSVRFAVGPTWAEAEAATQAKKADEGARARDVKIPVEGEAAPSTTIDDSFNEWSERQEREDRSRNHSLMASRSSKPDLVTRYADDYRDMSVEQLRTKWLQLMRKALRTQLTARASVERDSRVAYNTYGDAVPGMKDSGWKARGRHTQQASRLRAVENLLFQRGELLPDEDPFLNVTKSDVQDANKDLVGRNGETITTMSDEAIEAEARRAVELLMENQGDVVLFERVAILFAQASRPERNVDMSVFHGDDLDGELTVQEVTPAYGGTMWYGESPMAGSWYSRLHRAIIDAPQETATAEQWMGMIRNAAGGVSGKEIDAARLEGYLEGMLQDRQIHRDELLGFLEDNGVRLSETVRGAGGEGNAALARAVSRRRQALGHLTGAIENLGLGLVETRDIRALGMQETDQAHPITSEWVKNELLEGVDGVTPMDVLAITDALVELKNARIEHARASRPAPFGDLTEGRWGHEEESEYRRYAIQLNRPKHIYPSYQPPDSHRLPPNTIVDLRMTTRKRDLKRPKGEIGQKKEAWSFIEETQSDWAGDGAREGYHDPRELRDARSELEEAWATFEERTGIVYHRMSLMDADGNEVAAAFVEQDPNAPELAWSVYDLPMVVPGASVRVEWEDIENLRDERNIIARGETAEDAWNEAWTEPETIRPMNPQEVDAWADLIAAQQKYAELADRALVAPPDQPFKGLNDWAALAVRRALMDAAMGGKSGLSWVTGQMVADRYNLRRRLSRVTYDPISKTLRAYDHGGNAIRDVQVEESEIQRWVGEDIAGRLREAKEPDIRVIHKRQAEDEGILPDDMMAPTEYLYRRHPWILYDYDAGEIITSFTEKSEAESSAEERRAVRTVEDEGLEMGGEFHFLLYDKVIPRVARKEAKKLGLEVEEVELEGLTSKHRLDLGGGYSMIHDSEGPDRVFEILRDDELSEVVSIGTSPSDAWRRAVLNDPAFAEAVQEGLVFEGPPTNLRDFERGPTTTLGIRLTPEARRAILEEGLPTVREHADASYGPGAEAQLEAFDFIQELGLDPENRIKVVNGVGATAWVDIRGQELRDPVDVLSLLRPFRSKRVENFHEVLVGDDGRVVSHSMVTSGKIDYAATTTQQAAQLAARVKRTGVKKVVIAHNHPSGDPLPSGADMHYVQHIERILRDRHGLDVEVEQVVIDTDAVTHMKPRDYPAQILRVTDGGLLTTQGFVSFKEAESAGFFTRHETGEPADRSPFQGITSPERVGEWARMNTDPDNTVSVVYVDTRARAVALEPKSLEDIERLAAWLPQRMRAIGAHRVFLGMSGKMTAQHDYITAVTAQNGLHRSHVQDVVSFEDPDSDKARSAMMEHDINFMQANAYMMAEQFSPTYARRVFEDPDQEYPAGPPEQPDTEVPDDVPRDLFGNPVEGAVEQGDLMPRHHEAPLGATDARDQARATVSSLEGKVQRGAASAEELLRYNEALSFLRRDAGRGINEQELRDRILPDHTEPVEDTGDLFDSDDTGDSGSEVILEDPGSSPTSSRTVPPRDAVVYSSTIYPRLPGELVAPQKPQKGKPVAVVHVIDSIADITAAAGRRIPFRVGLMGTSKALGYFKVGPEVIRTRTANSIPTAAHEAAHAVEKILWGWPKGGPWTSKVAAVDKAMQNELVAMGKALYGDRKPAGGYKREGFAEYLRAWITQDTETLKMAPRFTEWFEEVFFGEQKDLGEELGVRSSFPDVGRALQAARDLSSRYQEQGSIARATANMIDPASPSARMKRRAKQARRLFSMEKLVEMAQPLYELAREAEKKTGVKLQPKEDPFLLLSALRTTHSARTKEMVESGMIDLAGNRVGDPLGTIRGIIKRSERTDFTIYMWAKRAFALWTDEQGPRDPGLSVQDTVQIIEELTNPRFERAAELVYEWNDGVLNYVAQASPIFKDIVDRIRERDPGNYVPLQREFEQLDSIWASGRGGAAGVRSPVKRLKGSGRRIKDPFQSMIANAESMVRAAHQRAVIDAIVKLSKVEGMGHLIEKVPKHQVPVATRPVTDLLEQIQKRAFQAGGLFKLETTEESTEEKEVWEKLAEDTLTFFAPAQQTPSGQPIIPIKTGDRVEWFYVDPVLFDALSSMDVYRLPSIAGIPVLEATLGKLAAGFRAGTTGLRASFGLLWNPLRDPQTMWVNTRSSAAAPRLLAEWFNGMVSTAFQRTTGQRTEFVDAFMRLGGEMAQVLGQDVPHTRRAARRLFEGRLARTLDPRNWFDWYRDFIQFPEGAPRVAELKLVAEDIGWEPGTPMTLNQSLELLVAAKHVTTDFTAAGELGRIINRMVPFHNAAIQGPRANLRAARRKPGQFAMRGLQLTLLSMGLWWLNKDEEWWEELPYREKFTHWWFKVRLNGREELVRIPRAFEIGLVFGAIPEMLLDSWYFQDPEAAGAWAKTALETSFPPLLPTVMEEAAEQLANEDFYWERPIVPQGLLRKPEEEQYTEYTSFVARALGDLTGQSPMRIDHAISGIFGPVARDVIEAAGLGGVGPGRGGAREAEPADMVIFGRLFERGGTTGPDKSVQALYEAYEAAQKIQASSVIVETARMRQDRLKLQDASRAVTAISMVMRYTETVDERRELAEIRRQVAQDALDSPLGGRGRFQVLLGRWEARQGRIERLRGVR